MTSGTIVAENRPLAEAWDAEEPHCYKLLSSKVEFSCEIGSSQRGQKLLNAETEESATLEDITRQLVRIQQTEKM
jgi:hypothetical protein